MATTSMRMRPRFTRYMPQTPDELVAAMREKLKTADELCKGSFIPENHFVIKIRREHQHFWSPQLALTIETDEEDEAGRTIVRGLYGPSPNIWTLFMFCYGALGVCTLFVGMIGFSEWSLERDASILWLLPLFAILAAGIYVLSQIGQRLGQEQTMILAAYFNTLFEQ
jgi:hypothetical protein